MSELKTVKDLVYRSDELYKDEIFLREYKKKKFHDVSFSQFRKSCDSIGVWIQKHFASKVHIAVIGTTSYEYLTAWFGIQCSGNVSVPIDTSNNVDKIADEIMRSDSEVVFLDDKHISDIPKFKEVCPAVKYFVHFNKKYDDMLFLGDIVEEYYGQIPEGDVEEEDLSAILFTSGTTGVSKGVMLTHANLIDNTTCYLEENYHGKKLLSVLPIHHVYCLTCDILCSLYNGVTVCINDSLMHIVRNLGVFKPEYATIVPMIAATILNKMQLAAEKNPDKTEIGRQVFGENFDILYSGGAYLSPDIVNGYKEFGIEIAQGYGMTECSPRICNGIRNCPKPESVGKIVDGCEVKIVDGEIWVRSKSVMKGYYKNPEETAKSLTPDGWLMTGDLGYKDDDGYLYITGRKKNLIILSNGENVSPEELENQFAFFMPIKEMVVYADDSVITAQIYPDPDYKSDDLKAEIQAKVDEVNETFPPAKRIVKVIFRDNEFVKTASKKIIRAKIHE